MEKLHIILICPDGTSFSLIKQTGTLALALNGAGYQVSVLVGGTAKSPLADLEGDVKVTHVAPWQVPFGEHFGQLFGLGGPVNCAFFQRRHFRNALKNTIADDSTIDIVHIMDVCYPHSLLAHAPEKLQMPVVGNVNRKSCLDVRTLKFWQAGRHKKALAALSPMVVSSHALLDEARTAGYEHIALIPQGVRTEQFKPALSKRPVRRALGLPEKTVLVCCMADITPQNAQLEMLEKCSPLSADRQLLFIGDVKDHAYFEKITERAEERDVQDFIHFLAPQDNPQDYLKASDIFMLLGGIEERHTTILEAQSAGLPVVLAPSESSLMLCNGNRSGVVLYPNNPLAKQAFEKLLSDPTYRQGRAMNARPFVVKSFSFKGMLADYCRLYQSL